jgi:hypothetical protein
MSINADQTDEVVAAAVFHRTGSSKYRQAVQARLRSLDHSSDGAARAAARRRTAEAWLIDLARMHGRRQISEQEWWAMRSEAEAELAAAQVEADRWVERSQVPVLEDLLDLKDRWPSMDLDRRRAALAAVIEQIDVNPAVRFYPFDPDRLGYTWRG